MSAIIGNKLDINYIQTASAKFNSRCYGKYWRTSSLLRNVLNVKQVLRIDIFQLPNNINIGKLFSKYELFFIWIKLISVLIYFKYCCYKIPSLELPCLLCHLDQISSWPTEASLQRNTHHPHSTTRYNYRCTIMSMIFWDLLMFNQISL